MSLETLKDKTYIILCKSVTEKEADRLLKNYDEDFIEFKKLCMSPAGIAAAILMGY